MASKAPRTLGTPREMHGGAGWGAPLFLEGEGSWGGSGGGKEMLLRALPLQVKCSQEALLRVFALSSCFPTLRTDCRGGPTGGNGTPRVEPPTPEGCGWAGGGRPDLPLRPHIGDHELPPASTGKREPDPEPSPRRIQPFTPRC